MAKRKIKEEVVKPLELWKPVPGYESLYEISSLGNVRSLGRTVKSGIPDGSRRVLAQNKSVLQNKFGHRVVQLFKDNKKKNVRIDGLIKDLFKGE